DLPHPLGGTTHHLGNDAMALLADGEHHNAGIAAIHGIAPLPLEAVKFDLFVRTKAAYLDSILHGDTSWGEAPFPPRGVLLQPASCSCAELSLSQGVTTRKLSAENGSTMTRATSAR